MSTLFVLFFSKTPYLLGDGDTGYHIRAGEFILSTRSIPKFDIFSHHTPPLPWTAHEWLSEVVMALVHQVCGMTGVVAFFSILLALTFYLLFKILTLYSDNILVAAAVTAAAFASSQLHWLARPHVFSFLLMITFQYLLDSWHSGRKNRLYLLPPLMLLWVNLHGGFLGGFILMGAYFLGNLVTLWKPVPWERPARLAKLKELSFTGVAALAACLVNPQGYRILLFPFKLVSDTFIMDHVSEFLSPNFHEFLPFKYLLLLAMGIFLLSRKKMEATELVLLLLFTHMALYSARYIPLFALVMAPVLSRHAGLVAGQGSNRFSRFMKVRAERVAAIDATLKGYLWPAAALLAVLAALWSGKVTQAFDPKLKCVDAAEFLMREKIGGKVFNNDEFGDYMIYRTYPQYRVFIDGRLDMYGSGIMKQYYQVSRFETGWDRVLDQHGITWIFFDTNAPLSRFLMHDPRWVLIYSDRVASIFVRDLPQYRELTGKYRKTELAAVPEKDQKQP